MANDDTYQIDFASIKSQAADIPLFTEDPIPAPVTPEPALAVDTTKIVEPIADKPVVDKIAAKVPEVPKVKTEAALEELDPDTHGDRLVKVKVDGQWEVKSLKEVAAGYSRTSHFTRQQQELATQRKEIEGKQTQFDSLVTERQQIQGFLSNSKLMYQFLKERSPELFAQAEQPIVQGDPNEIATVQQARDLIEAQKLEFNKTLEQMNRANDEKIATAQRDLENRRETAAHSESINTTLKDIFEKNPLLSKVPQVEDILRYQVAKMEPKTIAEANDAFRQVAQGIMEDLNDGFAVANKTKIATAAKLVTARIEPPGGSGPQIQPRTFKKADGSTDWNGLTAAAAELMK